jgi:hypothetical protein
LIGYSVAQEAFPEAATQTFKQGACVVLASGYLQEAGADPTVVMGIASGPGHNKASVNLVQQSVYLAGFGNLFQGNLDDGAAGVQTAATDRGLSYGIAKHSGTGTWYVDKTETTAKRVVVWGFWLGVCDGVQAAVGDTLGQIFFAFDATYFQGAHVV